MGKAVRAAFGSGIFVLILHLASRWAISTGAGQKVPESLALWFTAGKFPTNLFIAWGLIFILWLVFRSKS